MNIISHSAVLFVATTEATTKS